MLAATRRWFRRNRTPITVGLAAVGAGYVATQYVISKIRQARERINSEHTAQENIRRRFEQNQEDCTYTVMALMPDATTNMVREMNTEGITYEIQKIKAGSSVGSSTSPPSIADTNVTEEDGKSLAGTSASLQSDSGVHASQVSVPAAGCSEAGQESPAQRNKLKRQLWRDLTISAVTRAFTMIYTLALLTIFTRIQLNLLGRRSYISSVIALATSSTRQTISLENNEDVSPDQVTHSEYDVNRKYLAFSWWLLHRGWATLRQRVEGAVKDTFGHLAPRDMVTFETFVDLTVRVRGKVEGSTPEERSQGKWVEYLLPPRDMEADVIRQSGIIDLNDTDVDVDMPALRRLLMETSDLIHSPSFSYVLTQLLDAGFSWLVDKQLANAAFEQASPPEARSESKAVLLPKILSVLTRQAHAIGAEANNEYLEAMNRVGDLMGFAAVVYSSNWDTEIEQEGLREQVAAQAQSSGMPGSQASVAVASDVVGESIVMVDSSVAETQSSLESAWAKATSKA